MAAWSLFSKLKDGLSGADGPPKLETYALHLYGKLPIYKDFISTGFTEEGSKDFRDWLGNGFSRRWSLLEEYKGTEIPLHTFLLALPGGKRSVAGALWGSHDEGGLRQFPFTLFSVLPQGRPAAEPFVALSFLEVFEERAPTSGATSSRANGRLVLRDLPGGADRAAGEEARKDRRSGGEGGEGRSPSPTSPSRSSGRGPAPSGREFLARLKSACAAGGGAGAVRIPLGNLLPAELQVQIWLTWLEGGCPRGPRPVGHPRLPLGRPIPGRPLLPGPQAGGFPPPPPGAADYEFVEETAPAQAPRRRQAARPGRRRRGEGAPGRPPRPPAGWNGRSRPSSVRRGGRVKVQGSQRCRRAADDLEFAENRSLPYSSEAAERRKQTCRQ